MVRRVYLTEEVIQGKDYLFRGESNNAYQSNYSKKKKLRFTSRFYGYEIFDDICSFGDVVMYEMLPNCKLWDYNESVEDFIDEFDLQDYEVEELYKVYKINSLAELDEYGGDIEFDYHDFYHAQQLVCIAYLEDNYKNQYDGIIWYEPQDTPETQYMIWNDKAVRKLPYKEAKSILDAFVKELDDKGIDSPYKSDEWGDNYYKLHR